MALQSLPLHLIDPTVLGPFSGLRTRRVQPMASGAAQFEVSGYQPWQDSVVEPPNQSVWWLQAIKQQQQQQQSTLLINII